MEWGPSGNTPIQAFFLFYFFFSLFFLLLGGVWFGVGCCCGCWGYNRPTRPTNKTKTRQIRRNEGGFKTWSSSSFWGIFGGEFWPKPRNRTKTFSIVLLNYSSFLSNSQYFFCLSSLLAFLFIILSFLASFVEMPRGYFDSTLLLESKRTQKKRNDKRKEK